MIHREGCAACNSRDLYKMMDLGMMPNANNLVPKEELDKVKTYPLVYYWCGRCNLLQQMDMADREELFNEHYTYVTGVTKTIVEHYKMLATSIAKKANAKGLAYIIASNDGTEIGALKDASFDRVIGIEPSANLARLSTGKGHETINDFFSENLAEKLGKDYGRADAIIANNVLAHVPSPRDMLNGIRKLLKDDGYASIEVHWLRSLVKDVEIDTLYAEHYFVWTVRAMDILARDCGLVIEDIEYLPSPQAGSLRYWMRPSTAKIDEANAKRSVEKFLNEEKEQGVNDIERMRLLSVRANERKDKLVRLVKSIRNEGKEIALWTAPAKMSTILNFCNFTDKDIKCAYDGSQYKMNRYIPKANIPVLDEKLLHQDKKGKLPADYIIVGAWNLMPLAREKLSWYVERGGRLINPLTAAVE